MKRWIERALACALLAAAGFAHAVDFKSVAQPAVLFDAPSDKAKPLFIILRGTPVELVVSLDRWAKVRESGGQLLWVERRFLSDKRTLLVTAASAQARREANEKAPLVFEAAKDVILEWVEAGPPGWVKVRHADGQSGFVRITQVWGL